MRRLCVLMALAVAAPAVAGEIRFVTKPAAVRAGGKVTISFRLSAPTDVAVEIVDAKGKIVRHLGGAALGAKNPPPPPFRPGLDQSVEWDGKADAGRQILSLSKGRPVASAGCRARVRLGMKAAFDRFIGWDDATRKRRLPGVVNNTRFLILPWIRVPHLASKILATNLRRLDADWQQTWSHGLVLAETFVDSVRFRGTCYRASNWRYLGQTRGFSRSRTGFSANHCPKAVFVYELGRHGKERLLDQGTLP